ncbi:concanavalin A-like lectin/glucanase domain-containing protein [Rhizophagus diaphanus]|nr:concanavalin A-like lectin/glucanase domain-containing protein [Rhizophagus diaphanus] [Rhizophagus sp. MUCL 43196]
MMRGYSLEKDLRLLINNPKYSDIEILCEDEKKFYGCRALLAARSEVFDRLLYNGMKESYENKISFPKINSVGMEIVLEYTYTGSIKEESLSKDNIIEAFYAAEYLQLLGLQDFIMKVLKNTFEKNQTENYSPELLSKFASKMPLTEDNILLNLLVEAVATIPLNTIEFGRLSIAGLQYLLACTYEKERSFATPEYEVFRYSAILSAKQVSNDAYKTLIKRLPILEKIEQIENSVQLENKNKFITDQQKVAKELEHLVEFIDFKRIQGQALVDIIEPLEIVSAKIIINVYRHNTKSNNSNRTYIRGIPITNCINYVWDESKCGSKLIIEDNGSVVHAPSNERWQNVRAKTILENNGIYEWDVIIEKACHTSSIGVASENLDYEEFAGNQLTGWVLGSNGYCYNSNKHIRNYCPSFGDGARITIHLDMNKKTCAFTVNGKKYPEVPSWNNLPSKLYPVASLYYPARYRIQPHKKI